MIHAIALDTNQLFGKLQPDNKLWQEFRRYLEAQSCTILIPAVVVDELACQARSADSERLVHLHRDLKHCIKHVRTLTPVLFHPSEVDRLEDLRLVADSRVIGNLVSYRESTIGKLRECIGTPFATLDYPKISHQETVLRSLSRSRPFQNDDKGYRDFLIWLSIVQFLRDHPEYHVTLFTADGDILNKQTGRLHDELLSDLSLAAITEDHLTPVADLQTFLNDKLSGMLELVADWRSKLCQPPLYQKLAEFVGQQIEYFNEAFVTRGSTEEAANHLFVRQRFDPPVLITVDRVQRLNEASLLIQVQAIVRQTIIRRFVEIDLDADDAIDTRKESQTNIWRCRCSLLYRQGSDRFTDFSAYALTPEPVLNGTVEVASASTDSVQEWTIEPSLDGYTEKLSRTLRSDMELEGCLRDLGATTEEINYARQHGRVPCLAAPYLSWPILAKWGIRAEPAH